MVVYAEFSIPASGFRIGRAFAQFPGVEVELDRVVPTSDSVVPFVWVRGPDPSEVVRVAETEGAVRRISFLGEEEGDWALYRVVWSREFRDVVVACAEADLTLLSGRGTDAEWRFDLRTENRASLSEFQEQLRRHDVPWTVVRLSELDVTGVHAHGALTEQRIEAVLLAFEAGYFEEPRDVTLESLSAQVGISRQAFGGRLRRGLRNLVATSFVQAAE